MQLEDSYKNKVTNNLNVLRTIAIIFVLLIHTTTYYTMIHQNNNLLRLNLSINSIAQVAVPIFVFIAGYALTIGY